MKRSLFLLTVALTIPALCGCGRQAAPATAMTPTNNGLQAMVVLPPLQVKDTQHPPSGIDDAAKPLEGLSSANPNERLQVVRQAQDKWGNHKVAPGIDQLAIVGRWMNPVIEAAHITFNADGTFKNVALLRDTEGTYRFLSHNAIELTYPGMLYGENVVEMEYRVLGDALELKQFGDWVRYRRATH